MPYDTDSQNCAKIQQGHCLAREDFIPDVNDIRVLHGIGCMNATTKIVFITHSGFKNSPQQSVPELEQLFALKTIMTGYEQNDSNNTANLRHFRERQHMKVEQKQEHKVRKP